MGRARDLDAMTLIAAWVVAAGCQSQPKPAPQAPYYAPIVPQQGPPGAYVAPPPQSYPPPQYPPPQYPPPQPASYGSSYPPPHDPPPQYVRAEAPPPPARKRARHWMCFAGRPIECASTLLLELGYRSDSRHSVVTGSFGLLVHSGHDAFGATLGIVGVSDDNTDGFSLVSGRYRRYLGGWGVAADFSLGFGNGGVAGEVALGWADVLAVTAGVNSIVLENSNTRDLIFTTGIRLGSVGIGGVLYATLLAATSAR
jgi:hypothetical protein